MIKKTNGVTSRGNLKMGGTHGTEILKVGNNRKLRMREEDPKDPSGDRGRIVAFHSRGVART